MNSIYMLTDADIMSKIALRVKAIRLKQDFSQQALASRSGVSLSSVVRIEEGKIKSFDTLLRVLRTLGKLEVFVPLVEEEPISPNEYYRLVNETKMKRRKRASKSTTAKTQEESEW